MDQAPTPPQYPPAPNSPSPSSPPPPASTSQPTTTQTSQPTPSYASVDRRFIAVLLDGVIYLVFVLGLGLVLGQGTGLLKDALNDSSTQIQTVPVYLNFLFSVIQLAFSVGYPVFFTGKYGQTPGKMLLHVKVIRLSDGATPGYLRAFLREIIGKILSSFFLLGYLWAIWDKRKQTWHDKIAGTIVIKV